MVVFRKEVVSLADGDGTAEIMSILDEIDTHINENTDRLLASLNSIGDRLVDISGWLEMIYKK